MIAIHRHHIPLYFHIQFSNFTLFLAVTNHTTMELRPWIKRQESIQ